MEKRKKICLLIYSLTGGGAERVISIMADYWVEQGANVSVITIAPQSKGDYLMNEKVCRISVDAAGNSSNILLGITNNYKRIIKLRRVILAEKADAVISFLTATNILALIATFGLNVPVYISERNDPRMRLSQDEIREWLRKKIYPWANSVVLQTESVESYINKIIPEAKTVVIPNPARSFRETSTLWPGKPDGYKCLVAMGRLVREKGFTLLIPVFARLYKRFPDWKLVIVGEGELRLELEELVRSLQLDEAVIFTGHVKRPEHILKSSDVFVLSSYTEGFPNALMEAMSCGLPSVSFDCMSGPADLISDGVNGILVPPEDTAALEEALSTLLEDPLLREKMGEKAKRVEKTHSIPSVMARWNQLLDCK